MNRFKWVIFTQVNKPTLERDPMQRDSCTFGVAALVLKDLHVPHE